MDFVEENEIQRDLVMELAHMFKPTDFHNLIAHYTAEINSAHDWKMVGSPGMYDDLYECTRCEERYSTHADGGPDEWSPPVEPCKEEVT